MRILSWWNYYQQHGINLIKYPGALILIFNFLQFLMFAYFACHWFYMCIFYEYGWILFQILDDYDGFNGFAVIL